MSDRTAISIPVVALSLLIIAGSPAWSKAATAPAEKGKAGGEAKMPQATCFSSEGVIAVLQMQAEAWNKGDLDTFLSGYLAGPEISYISGSSEVWGYEALRTRYINKYGDKKETMGTLRFADLKVQDLGKSNALCIGRWHLEREGQAPVGGIFSLVFLQTAGGWKIIHDHTSVSDKPVSAPAHS